MEDYLQVDTPENVVFNYEIAGIGSRFLAALVDSTIILIGQIAIYILMIAFDLSALFGGSGGTDLTSWGIALLGLISFVLLWGYYIGFEVAWNGQSPGKRLAHLRVIRREGTPITLSEAIIRNIIRLVDFLPFFYMLGVVTMFIDGRSRRLGDLAAGTIVVRDREVSLTAPTLGSRGAPLVVDPANALPVERLSARDLLMAEDYLRRRYDLPDPQGLGRQIALALLRRMELPEERLAEMAPGQWIERIVRECHARQEE